VGMGKYDYLAVLSRQKRATSGGPKPGALCRKFATTRRVLEQLFGGTEPQHMWAWGISPVCSLELVGMPSANLYPDF